MEQHKVLIMKFGGTSVGSAERIRNVYDIVRSRLSKNPIVVVSAVGGITDAIIGAAKAAEKGKPDASVIREKHMAILKELGLPEGLVDAELDELEECLKKVCSTKELTKKMLDRAVSFGERMSSKIVAAHMDAQGVKARALMAYDIGFCTDSHFTDAELQDITYTNLGKNKELKERGIVNVVTGFIAKDREGNITTLGRGGSDYTAAIIGAAINAEEIQIWTDVNGIMSADPRIVKAAKSIPTISFGEAAELAYFGAKVLHPKTILPAMDKDIPVVVLNTHNPAHKGTRITRHATSKETFKAVSSKKNITVIRIVSSRMLAAHGFLAKIFHIFEKHKVVVDMITTSEVSVNVTIDNTEHLDKLVEELKQLGNVECMQEKAIICVIGRGMRDVPGVAGRIFSVCGKENINIYMISQGASQVNIGFVVDNSDADKAVIALHKALIENQ